MKAIKFILSVIIFITFFSCEKKKEEVISLIPYPQEIKVGEGYFHFNSKTTIVYSDAADEVLVKEFVNFWDSVFHLKVKFLKVEDEKYKLKNSISLQNYTFDKGEECYSLETDRRKIIIRGDGKTAFRYGLATLTQLIEIDDKGRQKTQAIKIFDYPRFDWRGAHFDVATHFFSVDFLKKHIDVLALYKINKLQLEIGNDYGWRLEIKKYPKLTEIGAFREDRRNERWDIMHDQRPKYDPQKPYYGGFYTQDEMRDLVAYAENRNIDIIPRINFPGQSSAMLASYPILTCSGNPVAIPAGSYKGKNVPVCAGSDTVYSFISDVITELSTVFQSSHIDFTGLVFSYTPWKSCEKCQAAIKENNLNSENQLRNYLVSNVNMMLRENGKRLSATSEIMRCDVSSDVRVVDLSEEAHGYLEIANRGHQLIKAPLARYYLNCYQSGDEQEPRAYPNIITLEDLYGYEAVEEKIHLRYNEEILGLNYWFFTDFVQTSSQAEYMLYPRVQAFAERAWSNADLKDYMDFHKRLYWHLGMMNSQGINYYVAAPTGLTDQIISEEQLVVALETVESEGDIRYTIDENDPDENSVLYEEPIIVDSSVIIKARTFLPDGSMSRVAKASYIKQTPKNAVKDLYNLYPGLKWDYYRGAFMSVHNMVDSNYVRSGVSANLQIPDEIYKDYFGLQYSGYIYAPVEGIYTFYLSSDDGSVLIIDGEIIIDNDGVHGHEWTEGQIALKSGYHQIKLKYFDLNYNQALRVEYEVQGIERQEIPAGVLFHSNYDPFFM